jgi:leucine dehydrogenase
MSLFETLSTNQHEQIVFCNDQHNSGLKAIIAIHNTQLGPSLGGCRMYPYASEEDALKDVLRLSRGMTYKAAVANLNLGGGKAIIIGDPKKIASESLFRAFGRFVNSLNGRYITAEDVGTNVSFMEWIRQETSHVVGTPTYLGGSGDPSPYTARGTFVGIKAAWKKATGKDNLKGVKVLVQGIGNVGYHLCKELHEVGAKLHVNDINPEAIKRVAKDFAASPVDENEMYKLDVDVYSPCALGATLNDKTIPLLKCPIIAGAANNQLAVEAVHGPLLQKAGILYAPDYVINAGGLISVIEELNGGGHEGIRNQIENIYDTLYNIFTTAENEKIPTGVAAARIAEERINKISRIKGIYNK